MRIKIKNRLIRGNLVCMQLPGMTSNATRWIAVYPFEVKAIPHEYQFRIEEVVDRKNMPSTGYLYHVADIELQNEFLTKYCGPEDITSRVSLYFNSIDEAADYIRKMGYDTDDLEEPWKNDYPL